jgi:hypothetical protein
MKINELISEQTDLDEGIGSFLGKAAGNVVGGVKAAWKDAKQGYKDAKSSWDDPAGTGVPAAPGTTPAADPGTAPAPTGGAPAPTGDTGRPYVAPAPTGGAPAPAADPGAIGSIMQAVDKLDPASKKQLAGELEKNINTPAQWPAGLPKFNSVTGQKFASPEEAEQVTNSPEFKQQEADVAAGKDPAGTPPPAPGAPPPVDTPTPPAPGAPPPAPGAPPPAPGATPPVGTPTPPAPGATPPADSKMTAAQQAALKAKLQGQRQAGKTTATQTGSGFKDYVGGSQNKLVTNPDGSTSMQKLQRESVEFRSNFLGMMI